MTPHCTHDALLSCARRSAGDKRVIGDFSHYLFVPCLLNKAASVTQQSPASISAMLLLLALSPLALGLVSATCSVSSSVPKADADDTATFQVRQKI